MSMDETRRRWPEWTPERGIGPALWERIGRHVSAGRGPAAAGGRVAAVFDADGTLWADDAGEAHLRLLEREGIIEPPSGWPSVFSAYEARCAEDVEGGYAYACEVMEGLDETTVQATAAAAWRAHESLVLQPVLGLLRGLQAHGVEVWIVSASNRWVVEAAATSLGLSTERVIAMSCAVKDGRLIGRALTPRPNGEGKVRAIEARVGVRPRLVFGNGVHDAPMLECAQLGVLVQVVRAGVGAPPLAPRLALLAEDGGWGVLPVPHPGER